MSIKIISVGNKPSPQLAELIAVYTKRFPRNISITWKYLKHSVSDDVSTSKLQESENILSMLNSNEFVVLLDENGTSLSSEQFSKLVFDSNRDITFVIGGAYGVSETVKKRANKILSLSSFVLPHQLVRLILSEQIYRAYTISINHPYHHS